MDLPQATPGVGPTLPAPGLRGFPCFPAEMTLFQGHQSGVLPPLLPSGQLS